jgi:hypothetical protein
MRRPGGHGSAAGSPGPGRPKRCQTAAGPNTDVNERAADPVVAGQAWAAWLGEVTFAKRFTADHYLGFAGRDVEGEPVLPCELLVPMIEESALHNGHAGPLRQRTGR